jgi:hypothetical protein
MKVSEARAQEALKR